MKAKQPITIEQTLTFQRKKYPYTLQPLGNGSTLVTCKAANIEQEFLDEDILALIVDLSNLILAERAYQKKHAQDLLRFRCTKEERLAIAKRAAEKRFPTISAYLRALALNGELRSENTDEKQLVGQKSAE